MAMTLTAMNIPPSMTSGRKSWIKILLNKNLQMKKRKRSSREKEQEELNNGMISRKYTGMDSLQQLMACQVDMENITLLNQTIVSVYLLNSQGNCHQGNVLLKLAQESVASLKPYSNTCLKKQTFWIKVLFKLRRPKQTCLWLKSKYQFDCFIHYLFYSFYIGGYQDHKFEHEYDCIWLQWFLMYLTDEDLISALKNSASYLTTHPQTG